MTLSLLFPQDKVLPRVYSYISNPWYDTGGYIWWCKRLFGAKVGMTVSASIPATVISIGVIRVILKKDSIMKITWYRQLVQR